MNLEKNIQELTRFNYFLNNNRGALKYLARSSHHAIHDLTEAIKLDQTCALAFYNRALCYQQVQNYKNALKDFSVVLMIGNYLKYKVIFSILLV